MKNKKHYIGLRYRITTSMVITIAVSFIIIISVIFVMLFRSIQKTVQVEFLERSEKYAYIFEQRISDAMSYLSIAASMLEAQVDSNDVDREQLQKTMLNIFDKYELIDGTSIMFEDNIYDGRDGEYAGSDYGTAVSGKICYYYYEDEGKTAFLPEALENDIEFELPHYKNAKDANKPIYTDPVVYEIDGRNIPMFTLSYPMHDKNNTFLGIVTVDLFLEELYTQLQNEKIYETGYMVVTNDKDQVICSPVYEDVGKDRKEAKVEYALPSKEETAEHSYADSFVNGKKSFVTTVSLYVPQLDSNFYVSIVAPVTEIYADGIRLVIILTLFSMFMLIVILFLLIKNIVKPVKEITEDANKIADGYLDAVVMFSEIEGNKKVKNEIYILAIALKKMLSQLNEVQRIKLQSLEFKHEKEKAEESSRTKSAFLANMSHEIRTPMNAIVGMAELILREEIPPRIYEHALSIKMASANLLAIINDILDFSKIESGKLEILPVKYQFSSLINDVISIIRMRVIEKPILFTANIDCNIPDILTGDEIRIRQILLNLLSNAYKYCEEGYISISINGKIEKGTVILTIDISDSGIGIKDEDIGKLFGDFVQVDIVRNKDVEGAGLGLAITRNLCLAMGGDISVSSVYGKGSVFTVTLPQKFETYEKIATVENPKEKRVLIYETRSPYSSSIVRSLDNLEVDCTLVTNQSMFYDEVEKYPYPFVFISSFIFDSAKKILTKFDSQTKLILLTEFGEVTSFKNVRTLAMPAHSISIANILNDVADDMNYNERAESEARFTAPSARILIVDDISTNLKVAEGLMSPYNMCIDACKSGAESIRLIQKNRYDCVFMDHMMPEMDGIEATLKIRELDGDYYKNVPIVALTANAVSGVKEMFLQNGFNDFLAKPVETLKLNEILVRWIPKEKQEKYTEKKQASDLPDLEIEGVNIKVGISMTGGTTENYLKTLAIFHKDCLDKIDEIESCLKSNELDNYTIHVHALKSAAGSIGALHLSEVAQSLEFAGKHEDIVFIQENNDGFLEELKNLLTNIGHVISIEQKSNLESVDEVDIMILKSEAAKLADALRDMDVGIAVQIMNALQKKNWDKGISESLDDISEKILICEYEEAVALIELLIKNT